MDKRFHTKYSNKSLKTVLLLLLAAALSVTTFLSGYRVRGEASDVTADPLSRPDESSDFCYDSFTYPSLMCADGEYLYVKDGTQIITFRISDPSDNSVRRDPITVPADAVKIDVFGGTVYYLFGGKVYKKVTGGADVEIAGITDASDFTVCETGVYAIAPSAGNTVLFVPDGPNASKEHSKIIPAELHNFAVNPTADGADIYAAYKESGSVQKIMMIRISPVSNTFEYPSRSYPSINSMQAINLEEGKNHVLMWHSDIIRIYEHNNTVLNDTDYMIPASDAESGRMGTKYVAAGKDGIFVLTSSDSIVSYDLKFETKPQVLVVPSYYTEVNDITTRFSSLYIADTAAERTVTFSGGEYSSLTRPDTGMQQPVSTAVDSLGTVYIAHHGNRITAYKANGPVPHGLNSGTGDDGTIKTDQNKPVTIERLRFDAKDNLFLLSTDGELYVKKQNADIFSQLPLFTSIIPSGTLPGTGALFRITSIDTSPNTPYLFMIAARISGGAEEEKFALRFRLGNTSSEHEFVYIDIGRRINLDDDISDNNKVVSEIAADTGETESGVQFGFYLLENGNKITAFDLDVSSGVYKQREWADKDGKVVDSIVINTGVGNSVVNRFTVSHIKSENGDSDRISYRDLVLSDHSKKNIMVLPAAKSGADSELDEPPVPGYTESANVWRDDLPEIVYPVNQSGALYKYANELSPLPDRLGAGQKIIVPDKSDNATFSGMLTDNTNKKMSDVPHTPLDAVTGYVNNNILSEPFPYFAPGKYGADENGNIDITKKESEFPAEASAFDDATPIYKYPSLHAPKITVTDDSVKSPGADGYVKKGTVFGIMPFIHSKDSSGFYSYGYRDNYYEAELAPHRWYRVKLEMNGSFYEGFVMSTMVSIYGSDPRPGIRPQYNAEIIPLDKKNDPLVGAIVYKDVGDGSLEIDQNFDLLAVGTKVEVIGAFDSSRPYTKIVFAWEHGLVTAYVPSGNIKYNGVNLVKVISIIVVVVTIVILGLIVARMVYVKRRKINKL